MKLKSGYPQIAQMDADKGGTKSNIVHARLKPHLDNRSFEIRALKHLRLSVQSAD